MQARPHRGDRDPLKAGDLFAAVAFDLEQEERRAARVAHLPQERLEDAPSLLRLEREGGIGALVGQLVELDLRARGEDALEPPVPAVRCDLAARDAIELPRGVAVVEVRQAVLDDHEDLLGEVLMLGGRGAERA